MVMSFHAPCFSGAYPHFLPPAAVIFDARRFALRYAFHAPVLHTLDAIYATPMPDIDTMLRRFCCRLRLFTRLRCYFPLIFLLLPIR